MKYLLDLLKISIYFLCLSLNWTISFQIRSFMKTVLRFSDVNVTGSEVVWYYMFMKKFLASHKNSALSSKYRNYWFRISSNKTEMVVNDQEFTNELIKILNHFCSKYKNFLITGDINMSIENVHLNTLLQLFNLNAIINSPTCYHSHIPTCIDYILTNQSLS